MRLWDPATGELLATLVSSAAGTIACCPDGRYKLDGSIAANRFWYAIGLCRFAPGELDPHLPPGTLTRVPLDKPLFSSG